MGSYKLTNEAAEDLIRIHQWGVRTHGEQQADQYIAAFFEHFEGLANNPLWYPAVDDIREGYRRSLCGRDSVYYRVENGLVVITAIIGQQDLDKWL